MKLCRVKINTFKNKFVIPFEVFRKPRIKFSRIKHRNHGKTLRTLNISSVHAQKILAYRCQVKHERHQVSRSPELNKHETTRLALHKISLH